MCCQSIFSALIQNPRKKINNNPIDFLFQGTSEMTTFPVGRLKYIVIPERGKCEWTLPRTSTHTLLIRGVYQIHIKYGDRRLFRRNRKN